jgi:predicted RNA methylase
LRCTVVLSLVKDSALSEIAVAQSCTGTTALALASTLVVAVPVVPVDADVIRQQEFAIKIFLHNSKKYICAMYLWEAGVDCWQQRRA